VTQPAMYTHIIEMSRPCKMCGPGDGRVDPKNGQNCVYCLKCGRMVYNAPRTELGEEPRSVRTRPDIKPSQKARVLERDCSRCLTCGRPAGAPKREDASPVILHIGHVLSVDDGRALGATDEELFDDENLVTVCEECNLGQGSRSLLPRLALRLIRAAKRRTEKKR
jgi:5-methylcytosine-specific restriction endonuclease McrA